MKQRFHAFITACLVLYLTMPTLQAWARTSADALMNFGMMPELANYITTSLVNVNSSGNLVLPAATSKKVSFQAGGTEYASVNSSGVTTAGLINTGTLANTGAITATAGVKYPAALYETVAAGTSAQGDGPLATGKYIHGITGFDETKVVTLPACAAGNIGEIHFILNGTTNKFAKIFPASGGTINALSADAAYTQGVAGKGGKVLMCFCQAANQWYCG